MKNFRTYELALQFYRLAADVAMPGHLKSQLLRASSSVALNLAEGYGRFSNGDKLRFYRIAFGSIRECQAIFDLTEGHSQARDKLDHLAAAAYKLVRGH